MSGFHCSASTAGGMYQSSARTYAAFDLDRRSPMTDVLLFHHAQGLTEGVRSFADELRAGGHTVVVPDFYDGRTFITLDEGMAYAGEIGFDQILERNVRSADDLPSDLVYAGFSLGEISAQKLAQTRPGARGALLFYSCIPITGDWASARGRTESPSRSTAWAQTRSSSGRETSTRPGRSSRPSTTPNCSSTPVISTTSPTVRCRRTTRRLLRSSSAGCSTSSAASVRWPAMPVTTGNRMVS